MRLKLTGAILLAFAIAWALCLPGTALADEYALQAGSAPADVSTGEQPAKATPSKGALTKFKSGAAGKVYAKAATQKGAEGYQFEVAQDRNFKVKVKRKTAKNPAATFCKLTGNKKYYGRVRAYCTVDGKKVWGAWSSVKSAKVTQAVIGVVYLPGESSTGQAKRWVRRGGAKPVDIKTTKVNPAKYDGLVIPGGGDVDPKLYGAKKRNSHVFGVDRKLDLLQMKVILKFAEADKPVMGLCRGAQVINVAFGGTLCQHIDGWHLGGRKVKIAKGSWLYKMFGSSEVTSHSHHQCVKKLGDGLVATQWDAKDGHIEAIEHTEHPVYGLQWHPEAMGERGTRVAKSFIAICSKYSSPRK